MPSRACWRPGWVVLALLGLPGCASFLTDAETAYLEGRYLEAAETLAAREQDVPRLPAHEQGRYSLYRGLALLRLGQLADAQLWLSRCRAIDTATSGKLTPPERALLSEGSAGVRAARARQARELGGEDP